MDFCCGRQQRLGEVHAGHEVKKAFAIWLIGSDRLFRSDGKIPLYRKGATHKPPKYGPPSSEKAGGCLTETRDADLKQGTLMEGGHEMTNSALCYYGNSMQKGR